MSIKAEITPVSIGHLTIEGLMNENGDFGVAVPQITDKFRFDKNQASRDIKALMGNDFLFEKWRSPFSPKAVNVILLEDFKDLLFILAQKGDAQAINMWNNANPDLPQFLSPRERVVPIRSESKVESRIYSLYLDWNPQRQVVTDFGIADIVHDYGVVEIKEFKSISSAHKAIGQAMSYGSILNRQPEVVLFNVPDDQVERVIRMFTAIGMLVLIYTHEGTSQLLARKILIPNYSNADEIAFQLKRNGIG